MTNPESDGLFDNDWDDCGELSWSEADWQKYLATQETAVRDYIKHYDQLPANMDRIDEAARRMGWELAGPPEAYDAEDVEEDDDELFEGDWDPYTLHRNPVYISTRALYLSLIAHWERVAAQPGAGQQRGGRQHVDRHVHAQVVARGRKKAQRTAQPAGPVHGGFKARNEECGPRLRGPGPACLLDQLGIRQQHDGFSRMNAACLQRCGQLRDGLLPAQRIRRRQGGVGSLGWWHE